MELISMKEAAKELQISRSTVRKYLDLGILRGKPVHVFNSYKVDRESFADFHRWMRNKGGKGRRPKWAQKSEILQKNVSRMNGS